MDDMTTTRSRTWPAGPWAPVLASLVPWAAFLVATALADRWVQYKSGSLAGLVRSAPFYLGFVALPSALPIAAARAGVMRLGVVVVMTAVAAVAGVLVVTTDDAQAGLAVLLVPMVAIPLGLVLWIGYAVTARRPTAGPPPEPAGSAPAGLSDRLAALAIDVAILTAALIVPLTSMSHAKLEVAAGVVGVAVATIYLAALTAVRGRTVGQALLGLAVVDARTLERVTPAQAFARSLIVVLELAATPTFVLALPALAELLSVSANGRSITDTVVGTSVVTTR